LKHITALS